MCSDEEQDAVEARAAEEGLFEEQPLLGAEVAVIEVVDPVDEEHPDPPIDPLDVPDEYDLPMYGAIIACPKCNTDRLDTRYHAHGVLSEPCGTRFGWPNVMNLGEHLCRQCTVCQYGWPEAVASGA